MMLLAQIKKFVLLRSLSKAKNHESIKRKAFKVLLLSRELDWKFGRSILSKSEMDLIVNRMSDAIKYFPRSLYSFNDAEAFAAPVRGVGSPNGCCVTLYQTSTHPYPSMLTYAGCTGDPKLNAKIFASFYALAIASQAEPTFLSANAGGIKLAETEADKQKSKNLLKFTLGPAGAIESTRGIPTAGMSAEEAIMLVSDFISETQNETGLVQIHHWHYSNAVSFEEQIRRTIGEAKDRKVMIKNSDESRENIGVIHSIPVLFKTRQNEIKSLEIEIPFKLMGVNYVYQLMQNVREEHMQLLLAACIKRINYAKKTLEDETKQKEFWDLLKSMQKDQSYCETNPFVMIEFEYDFEKGVTIKLTSPRRISRREFEEKHRPVNIKSAREFYDKFVALKEKLSDINIKNGKADVLSLKYLIDSMIRRSPLMTTNIEIEKEYEKWMKPTSLLIWSIINDYATKAGINIDCIAADNIVFNSELLEDKIIIRPLFMVDINNFQAEINGIDGTIKILSGKRIPKLSEMLVHNEQTHISDLASLYGRFDAWVAQKYDTKVLFEKEQGRLEQDVRENNQSLFACIQLNIGKQLFFKEQIEKAIDILDKLHNYDFASIYLWRATVHLFAYYNKLNLFYQMSQYLKTSDTNPASLTFEKKINFILNLILNKLSIMNFDPQAIRRRISDGTASESDKLRYAVSITMQQIPFGHDSSEILEQLIGKNEELIRQKNFYFIKKLIAGEDIHKLQEEEFCFNADDKTKINNYFHALSSVELLVFAESVYKISRELSAQGMYPNDLLQKINILLREMSNLTFDEPGCKDDFNELKRTLLSIHEFIDSWGVYSYKHQLNALAELIANEALSKALSATEVYPYDIYNIIIPSFIILKWKRGYATMLEFLLRLRRRRAKKVGNFSLEDLSADITEIHGMVTADMGGDEKINLYLNRKLVARIGNLSLDEKNSFLNVLRDGVRIGLPAFSHSTVIDRIKEIELIDFDAQDEKVFYENKDALIPLIARRGLSAYRIINDMFDESQVIGRSDGYQLRGKFVNKVDLTSGKSVFESSVGVILINANSPYKPGRSESSEAELTEIRNSEEFKSLFGDLSEEDAQKIIDAAIRPQL